MCMNKNINGIPLILINFMLSCMAGISWIFQSPLGLSKLNFCFQIALLPKISNGKPC